jgi:hypothetical protein
MSDKEHQESAFPGTDARGFVSTGMTLRDWFAGQAIAGLMEYRQQFNIKVLAVDAYEVADAMMEARKK